MILKFINYSRPLGIYYSDVTAVTFKFEGHDENCQCPECCSSRETPQYEDYVWGRKHGKNYLQYLYCHTKDEGYLEGYGPGVKRIPLPLNNYLIYLMNDEGKTIEKLHPLPFNINEDAITPWEKED